MAQSEVGEASDIVIDQRWRRWNFGLRRRVE
jgi:hypothetical protein